MAHYINIILSCGSTVDFECSWIHISTEYMFLIIYSPHVKFSIVIKSERIIYLIVSFHSNSRLYLVKQETNCLDLSNYMLLFYFKKAKFLRLIFIVCILYQILNIDRDRKKIQSHYDYTTHWDYHYGDKQRQRLMLNIKNAKYVS